MSTYNRQTQTNLWNCKSGEDDIIIHTLIISA